MKQCVLCGKAATIGLVLVLKREGASGDYNRPWFSCAACLQPVRAAIERMREDSLENTTVAMTLTLEEREL
jgi:hypothetical protein